MKTVFLNFYMMVIVMVLIFLYVFQPVYMRLNQDRFAIAEKALTVKQAKGAFYVVEQDLLRLPDRQWRERIEMLKPQFGYFLEIYPYSDLQLSRSQKKQLRQGEFVLSDDLESIYHQVGDRRMVLRKGPFTDAGTTEIDDLLLYEWVISFLLISLPCAVWGLFFWRNLRIISQSAGAFGAGDFRVRVNVGRFSALTSIATTFNAMAGCIQRLIDSHKELTNAVSHELRSPIARIRFGLEMQDTAPTPEKRECYTQGLLSDVNILEELVAELLTYAGLDRDKPDLCFACHAAAPWLKGVLAEISSTDSQVACRVFFSDEAVSSNVWFDPKYLGRAVGNLVQNARRHANQQVHLILEHGGETCSIHVDDDGPGIAEEDRKRVFNPFTRLDTSRSRSSGGYGLGLAIAHRIMTWHGGNVSVTDSPLGGARFTIQWPGCADRHKHQRTPA